MFKTVEEYERKILAAWEEVSKKGQLTFWILLSLRVQPQHMLGMKKFIEKSTNSLLVADDKSMYRALRRLVQMDLIEYKEEASKLGPSKKIYTLTEIGKNVLEKFINRNITGIYFKPEIKSLLYNNNKGEKNGHTNSRRTKDTFNK